MKPPNITPGDWVHSPTGSPEHSKQYTVYPEDAQETVALVYQGEHAEANARAIAALPACLQALENFAVWLQAPDLSKGSLDTMRKHAEAALTQAGYTFDRTRA